MGIRMWHQSTGEFTSEDNVWYQQLLSRRAAVATLPDTEVVLHGVAQGTWPKGAAAGGDYEVYECLYSKMFLEAQCARNVVEAEDTGYDAFVYSCFEDPGLHEGRSMVDIPVVGILETSILIASTMGMSIALIGTGDAQTYNIAKVAHKNRLLNDRIVCVEAMELLAPGLIDGEKDGGAAAVAAFTETARVAIAKGADVLIPAEGIVNVLLADVGLTHVDGVPVVDSWSAVLNFAEMLVRMRRTTGYGVSRKIEYARAGRAAARHVAVASSSVLAR